MLLSALVFSHVYCFFACICIVLSFKYGPKDFCVIEMNEEEKDGDEGGEAVESRDEEMEVADDGKTGESEVEAGGDDDDDEQERADDRKDEGETEEQDPGPQVRLMSTIQYTTSITPLSWRWPSFY